MNVNSIVSRARAELRQLGVELPALPAFVDDRLVDYGTLGRVYVRRADIFGPDATDRWLEALREDASWYHFNAMVEEDGTIVTSVRCGETTRRPGSTPAVNVSVERMPMRIEER